MAKDAYDTKAEEYRRQSREMTSTENPPADLANKVKQKVEDINVQKQEAKVPALKGYKAGGSVSSASKRADGCAQRGKTRGRMM